jgi:hypothetical protein
MDFPIDGVRLIISRLRGAQVSLRDLVMAVGDLLKYAGSQLAGAQGGEEVLLSGPNDEGHAVGGELLDDVDLCTELESACEAYGASSARPARRNVAAQAESAGQGASAGGSFADVDWAGILRTVLQKLLQEWLLKK